MFGEYNLLIEQSYDGEKNTVLSLEAKASDGNATFTPRQWLEQFRKFAKREHKIDIAPLMKVEDITEWSGKEQLIQKISSGEWDPKHCTR